MNKFTYIFICLLLSLNFWNLSIPGLNINPDLVLIATWFWLLFGVLYYWNTARNKKLNSNKYNKYIYWILVGVLISTFSAYIYWEQALLTTFLAQRWTYSLVALPVMLFVQPSFNDIIKGLKWITVGTIIVWILVAINPALQSKDLTDVEMSGSDFGYYVPGIQLVVFYFYFVANQLISKSNIKVIIEFIFLLIFIFLFQNRSMLIGVLLITIYTLINFKSQYKTRILYLITFLILIGVSTSKNIWLDLYTETTVQLTDSEYNRFISLNYYLHEYSPNLFCTIFGNGFPSVGNSALGDLRLSNYSRGIYASDLGMIGMWTDYGIIPIIAIYTVLFKIVFNRNYPMYLKFISLHIIFVPTIFSFWRDPSIFFFVLIFYLFAFNTERINYLKKYAFHHNRKL